MSDHNVTIGEEIAYQGRAKQAEASKARSQSRQLSVGEKVTFAIAAVFSTVILLVAIFLTVMGFIFSPLADTLVFGLLMGACGVTSYVIWKNGR